VPLNPSLKRLLYPVDPKVPYGGFYSPPKKYAPYFRPMR